MRRILVLGLVVLTALGLSACSDDDDEEAPAPALVRVAHFSPDAPMSMSGSTVRWRSTTFPTPPSATISKFRPAAAASP